VALLRWAATRAPGGPSPADEDPDPRPPERRRCDGSWGIPRALGSADPEAREESQERPSGRRRGARARGDPVAQPGADVQVAPGPADHAPSPRPNWSPRFSRRPRHPALPRSRSSRPYSTRPSNSPTTRCSSQPSPRGRRVPAGRPHGQLQRGGMRPSRYSATRLRLSPDARAASSAKSTARAANGCRAPLDRSERSASPHGPGRPAAPRRPGRPRTSKAGSGPVHGGPRGVVTGARPPLDVLVLQPADVRGQRRPRVVPRGGRRSRGPAPAARHSARPWQDRGRLVADDGRRRSPRRVARTSIACRAATSVGSAPSTAPAAQSLPLAAAGQAPQFVVGEAACNGVRRSTSRAASRRSCPDLRGGVADEAGPADPWTSAHAV
jgi:hypothetical protein